MNSASQPHVTQPRAIQWQDNFCSLIDQTQLPGREHYLEIHLVSELIDAIKRLAIRGAPALGVAGAYGVVLAAQEALGTLNPYQHFEKQVNELKVARPTAINLKWGVERVFNLTRRNSAIDRKVLVDLVKEAQQIEEEDRQGNEKMARWGAELFHSGSALTICNTGDLCTAGGGTAFGVLREAFRRGRLEQVIACETRPLLQGLRLTAWELQRNGIPFNVICDNMAAHVMSTQKIQAVIAGADRIAANGDAANKIGTYGLAVLAHFHSIPFYLAAPTSTFDLKTLEGPQISIEQRSEEEIFDVLKENRPKIPFTAYNPAFDVTPANLIAAIVTEKGIIRPPNRETIKNHLEQK